MFENVANVRCMYAAVAGEHCCIVATDRKTAWPCMAWTLSTSKHRGTGAHGKHGVAHPFLTLLVTKIPLSLQRGVLSTMAARALVFWSYGSGEV
jgi:hypothetical protein